MDFENQFDMIQQIISMVETTVPKQLSLQNLHFTIEVNLSTLQTMLKERIDPLKIFFYIIEKSQLKTENFKRVIVAKTKQNKIIELWKQFIISLDQQMSQSNYENIAFNLSSSGSGSSSVEASTSPLK
jgi:hypothetical protein